MAGPITDGKSFNFFQKVTVSGADFTEDADVVFNFRGQEGFYIVNYGPGTVQCSYNGNTVHGEFKPSTPTESQQFDHRRVSRIWFKLTSGGASEVVVQAWAAK
ncbi:MAG TPA: hypothetical protein VI423_00865 [Paenisporosarcina sp.]|nr:hypothetical protein [Paenisporosarcina sp.]